MRGLTCTPEEKKNAGVGGSSTGVETGATEVGNQSVVKYETSDGCGVAHPTLDGDSGGHLASNDPLDDPFDEFTIEELSTLP